MVALFALKFIPETHVLKSKQLLSSLIMFPTAATDSSKGVSKQQHDNSAGEEPCDVCTDFKKLTKPRAGRFSGAGGSASASSTQSAMNSNDKTSSNHEKLSLADQSYYTTEGGYFPCPPDSGELGTSTWTFLHTMAAYYPETPSTEQSQKMSSFIDGLASFYPCGYCAKHMQQELPNHPPRTESRSALSQWFCELHNRVNVRQGKPEFDCSRVFERWKRSASKNPDC